LTIPGTAREVRTLVGEGLLERAGVEIGRVGLSGRIGVVADQAAWRHHGERLRSGLGTGWSEESLLLVPSGEHVKSLEHLGRIYDWLLSIGVERSDCLVAFGGGVCGDLAGFAAATVLRGIALVMVPTTLLAQVDSSIGGKTAINHPRGKNLIGAYHQAELVLADVGTLRTLPPREVAAGWAEVVKMAITLDAGLFADLERQPEKLSGLDTGVTVPAIARSIELKGQVVAQDEREGGLRMVLNYGHTIGHAIEAATDYRRYLHGEAVAVGMVGVGSIGQHLGVLPHQDRERQDHLLRSLGLPRACPDVDADQLWAAMLRDKKARAGQLAWVLCQGIGRAVVRRDVPPGVVDEVLKRLTARTAGAGRRL
jgi:3-dehydroquinate synthase